MTKLILIRHGEPRYDEVIKRKYPNQGYDLGKLTEKGVHQAKKVSNDSRLKGATIIVSSPYTRALQTAAIISRLTNIELTVENDLHEWMPDISFSSKEDLGLAYPDFMKNQGELSTDSLFKYETYEDLSKRVRLALDKYKSYEKVIVVCHGIVMSTMTHINDQIEHCGIREVLYE